MPLVGDVFEFAGRGGCWRRWRRLGLQGERPLREFVEDAARRGGFAFGGSWWCGFAGKDEAEVGIVFAVGDGDREVVADQVERVDLSRGGEVAG